MSVKVLIVDDSAFMRRVISDMIKKDSSLQVVDTARNGQEAVEKIHQHKPDVVTLDVEMPILDGVGALKRIMDECPVPVLMVSGVTKEGADITMRALELGAVDFIAKPMNVFKFGTDDMAKELCSKIKSISKINVKKIRKDAPLPSTKPKLESAKKSASSVKKSTPSNRLEGLKKIIAIGTSTGGPRALQSVIPRLPSSLDAAVVIVQHMPPGFTKSLAERMNSLSSLTVKEAEDGELLKRGWVYIAPGDKHLRIVKNRANYVVSLGEDAPVTGHKPSADALFASIADLKIDNVIGVIMTGMGADGAAGLAMMKSENDAHIIAQDKESCVVFGMPRAAVAKGIVDKVVPLGDISDQILKAMEV